MEATRAQITSNMAKCKGLVKRSGAFYKHRFLILYFLNDPGNASLTSFFTSSRVISFASSCVILLPIFFGKEMLFF